MSVDLILSVLKELNKNISGKYLASIILFYSTSSINLEMNLHFNNLILYLSLLSSPKITQNRQKKIFFFQGYAKVVTLMLRVFLRNVCIIHMTSR